MYEQQFFCTVFLTEDGTLRFKAEKPEPGDELLPSERFQVKADAREDLLRDISDYFLLPEGIPLEFESICEAVRTAVEEEYSAEDETILREGQEYAVALKPMDLRVDTLGGDFRIVNVRPGELFTTPVGQGWWSESHACVVKIPDSMFEYKAFVRNIA